MNDLQNLVYAQTVPSRVVIAFNFVTMMRNSACKHIDHEMEFEGAATVIKCKSEAGAYSAAMDALRTYFNGENFIDLFSAPATQNHGETGDGPGFSGVPTGGPTPGGNPGGAHPTPQTRSSPFAGATTAPPGSVNSGGAQFEDRLQRTDGR